MMNRTLDPDKRLNELVDEVSRLTGETYVVAMCQALEERRDRLLGRRRGDRRGRVLRLTLEAGFPASGR